MAKGLTHLKARLKPLHRTKPGEASGRRLRGRRSGGSPVWSGRLPVAVYGAEAGWGFLEAVYAAVVEGAPVEGAFAEVFDGGAVEACAASEGFGGFGCFHFGFWFLGFDLGISASASSQYERSSRFALTRSKPLTGRGEPRGRGDGGSQKGSSSSRSSAGVVEVEAGVE